MEKPPFELLEVLIATAESPNLVEAARRLGLSQPAVSLKLRALEKAVALPVFALSGRRKTLTPYGRELYEMARYQAETQAREFELVSRRYQSAEKLTLKIGCRPELFEHLGSRLEFEGRLEFASLNSHEAVLRLLDHTLDLAITYELPDSPSVIAKKLFVSEPRLLIPKKLAKGDPNDPEYLKSMPWLTYDRDGHLLADLARHAGLELADLRIRYVAQDWRLLVGLVERGEGLAIVPSYVRARAEDVVSVKLSSKAISKLQFYALYHRVLLDIPAYRGVIRCLSN